ncbi:MAG: hypothetical protein H7Z76_00880 [Methylotenera sp.]|nr:hypothetical protein [Flavobacterium sp.]
MKIFITRLAIFVLPILLLAFPLDLLLSHLLKNTREYAGEVEVWNDIYDGKINADVLVYGSSRAWKHINSQLLEDSLGMSTYNLGMDGQLFWLEYLRHKIYLQYNHAPKLILLSLDIHSLERNEELYNKNQFLPYMLWNKDIYQFTSPYKGFTWVDYNIPLVRYLFNQKATIHTIISTAKPNQEKTRNKGYKGVDLPWDVKLEIANKRKGLYNAYVDSAALKLLEQFVTECATKKIELILVYAPEYIESQKFFSHKNDVMATYTSLAQKHHLRFLNYLSHTLCSHKDLFFNNTHLNKKGSDLFSEKLAADLKNKKGLQVF